MIEVNLLQDHKINAMDGSCPVAQIRMALQGIETVAKSPAMQGLNNDKMTEGELLRAISDLNASGEKLGFVIVFA